MIEKHNFLKSNYAHHIPYKYNRKVCILRIKNHPNDREVINNNKQDKFRGYGSNISGFLISFILSSK